MELNFTATQLKELKPKYDEYRQERKRLIEVLNYARTEYYKRYNHLKWDYYSTMITSQSPEFKNGHYKDSQLDCLYHQVLDAQENYKRYRESNELFNSIEFEELMLNTFTK